MKKRLQISTNSFNVISKCQKSNLKDQPKLLMFFLNVKTATKIKISTKTYKFISES